MALTNNDLHQVEEFVRTRIAGWLPQSVIQLGERIVRVEEELKHQREAMQQGFARMDRRFEEAREHTDKRFEEMQAHTNRRFEEMQVHSDERFADVQSTTDKRFEDQNKRFGQLTWLIGIGFVVISSLTTLFALIG